MMKNVPVLLFFLITTLVFAEDVPVEAGVLENANPCAVQESMPTHCQFTGDVLAAMVQHLELAASRLYEMVEIPNHKEFQEKFQSLNDSYCEQEWYMEALPAGPMQLYWFQLCIEENAWHGHMMMTEEDGTGFVM